MSLKYYTPHCVMSKQLQDKIHTHHDFTNLTLCPQYNIPLSNPFILGHSDVPI